MANPRLTKAQRIDLFKPLFDRIVSDIQALSDGDPNLMWALRRKIAKELVYLERSTPAARNKLKLHMWLKQSGLCAFCNQLMEQKGSELDRLEALHGYIESNVRLVHHECHIKDQASKNYS